MIYWHQFEHQPRRGVCPILSGKLQARASYQSLIHRLVRIAVGQS